MWLLYYKCFILYHLLKKYTFKGTQLLITIIDLSAAFNLLNRDILWKKPVTQKMEFKLFYLTKILYSNSWSSVHTGTEG